MYIYRCVHARYLANEREAMTKQKHGEAKADVREQLTLMTSYLISEGQPYKVQSHLHILLC